MGLSGLSINVMKEVLLPGSKNPFFLLIIDWIPLSHQILVIELEGREPLPQDMVASGTDHSEAFRERCFSH